MGEIILWFAVPDEDGLGWESLWHQRVLIHRVTRFAAFGGAFKTQVLAIGCGQDVVLDSAARVGRYWVEVV